MFLARKKIVSQSAQDVGHAKWKNLIAVLAKSTKSSKGERKLSFFLDPGVLLIFPFIIHINGQSFMDQISISSKELTFASLQKISSIYAALKGKINSTPGLEDSLLLLFEDQLKFSSPQQYQFFHHRGPPLEEPHLHDA